MPSLVSPAHHAHCDCGHDHADHDSVADPAAEKKTDIGQNRNAAGIFGVFVGGALVANSYLGGWIYEGGLPDDQRVVSSLCAFAGALFLSVPLLWRTARAVWRGKIHIGEMASLAIIACFATGAYQEAGLVAFFLMLAELLETRSALGARAAVEGLIRLTPKEARLVRDGREETLAVGRLKIGDRVRVRPGENIPTDGKIVGGETTINQASVTGESLPVDRGGGDTVFAGTVNLTGLIDLEVTKLGEDTTLGVVRQLILQAEATRLPITRLIDQYVQWYAPAILMIAAAILYFSRDGETGLQRAIAALVIACPCALVLATPTAMVAGLSAAARLGILIKNVANLESASTMTAVMLDKTGTMTTGELTVSRLAPAAGIAPAELLRYAAAADRHSNHPAARALLKVATEARVPSAEATEMQESGGRGVSAVVEGKKVLVGRGTWLTANGVNIDALEAPQQNEDDGFSVIYVAVEGQAWGWIGMMDKTRPDAAAALAQLKQAGVRNITMVTGDRWGAARRVAAELGCTDLLAECLPAKKLEAVENLQKQHYKVMVVGDGVNDAPALAAGDLGVAMGAAGNDIAINSASVALLSSDLNRLPYLINLSKQVRRVVTQNLIFAVLFVVVGLLAAGFGYLTPIVAALLHNVGSLLVIFNSAKIVRFGEELGG
ncbi:MAG: cation-translocating P-type ATPase [Planctomycetota bacterium]|jgi:Cd2+/Zn2+-exporting ATPase|nr:cation-translocating P-type ATPase [Planctomycetota bacterium]